MQGGREVRGADGGRKRKKKKKRKEEEEGSEKYHVTEEVRLPITALPRFELEYVCVCVCARVYL